MKTIIEAREIRATPLLVGRGICRTCDAEMRTADGASGVLPFPLTSKFLAAILAGIGFVATVLVSSAACAQAAPPQNADVKAGASEHLPPGTTICAVLEKTVDAKKAKAGDAIVAKTTLAVLSHGKVAIATGAKILGHVTEVKAHSKGDAKSELRIEFDRVALKDGGDIPLQLTLQAIGYGGLPRSDDDDSNGSLPATSAIGSTAPTNAVHRSNFPPPRPEPADTPTPQAPGSAPRNPALDGGSKGVVGIDGLTLTEGTDASMGSVISATKKNVKLERGSQLILRVIGAPANSAKSE